MQELEPDPEKKEKDPVLGKLIVVVGPMFSGKTSEAIDFADRAKYAQKRAIIIKPDNDTRYSEAEIVTHSGERLIAYRVDKDNPVCLLDLVDVQEETQGKIDIVVIDEGQFFKKEGFVEAVSALVGKGKTVIVAGLPTDFRNEPFGAIPVLMAKADQIVLKRAVCTYTDKDGNVCGEDAGRTQRLIENKPADYNDPIVLVGGKDYYEARCTRHHMVPRTVKAGNTEDFSI